MELRKISLQCILNELIQILQNHPALKAKYIECSNPITFQSEVFMATKIILCNL